MRPIKGPSKARFDVIYRTGTRRHAPVLRMIECPGTGLIGIAVTKSVGSKPLRNRVRRRVRAALATCNWSTDRDRVFIAGSSALRRPLPELVIEVEHLLMPPPSSSSPSSSSPSSSPPSSAPP